MCVGIPGRVTEITDAERNLAMVEVGGVKREVVLACVVDADCPIESCVGEWVLIHVGFAMSRLNEQEAQKTLRLLTELGEAQAELEAMAQTATAPGGKSSEQPP